MNHRYIIIPVLLMAVLSGCYIDFTGPTGLNYSGNISNTADGFYMDGRVSTSAGEFSAHRYRNLSIVLYNEQNESIYREDIGSLDNASTMLQVSIAINATPEYVIFEGPNLWKRDGGVEYFYRYPRAQRGYGEQTVTERCELPPTPPC